MNTNQIKFVLEFEIDEETESGIFGSAYRRTSYGVDVTTFYFDKRRGFLHINPVDSNGNCCQTLKDAETSSIGQTMMRAEVRE